MAFEYSRISLIKETEVFSTELSEGEVDTFLEEMIALFISLWICFSQIDNEKI